MVAMTSGLIGVPLGSYLAQRFRLRSHNCDPLICAWGLFISAPMVFIALVLARINAFGCFFFVFLAEVSLNLCWSIVADILLVSAQHLIRCEIFFHIHSISTQRNSTQLKLKLNSNQQY